MTVINRRNAVAGWAAWHLAKTALRRKVEPPPPLYKRVARRPEVIAAAILGAMGVATAAYLRLRQSNSE